LDGEASDGDRGGGRATAVHARAAGIPEYWVVDCVAESIEVHRTPQGDGYRDVARVGQPTATVTLQAFPDVVLTLAEIFA